MYEGEAGDDFKKKIARIFRSQEKEDEKNLELEEKIKRQKNFTMTTLGVNLEITLKKLNLHGKIKFLFYLFFSRIRNIRIFLKNSCIF